MGSVIFSTKRGGKVGVASKIVFCAVALLVVFAGVGYKVADMLNVLPAFLDNGKRSYLEGKNLQPLPDVSLSAFLEGDLQDEVEDYASGLFPARDGVLVANASVQRAVIEVANVPFGFEVWPTGFSSPTLASASRDALFAMPDEATDAYAERLEKAASSINDLAEEYETCSFTCYIPDRGIGSFVNPAIALMSNAADTSFIEEHFAGQLNESVSCIVESHESVDEYFDSYYSTDHHWTINGAYEGYVALSRELGVATLEPSDSVSYPQYPFYGSSARTGLFLDLTDCISDYEFDLPEMKVWRNGGGDRAQWQAGLRLWRGR